jgi:hypothetical protein
MLSPQDRTSVLNEYTPYWSTTLAFYYVSLQPSFATTHRHKLAEVSIGILMAILHRR